jgi:hypothetical protein
MATEDISPAGASSAARRCVFCCRPGKLTNEHVIPWWLESGEHANNALVIRERGGPDYEPWRDSRQGRPRDLQAKAPCAECNNTWMNEMDNALAVLGPQLVKGKPVKLTKAKKVALAAWSVKFALMLQLIYPRDSRFVIPGADYPQFYADRQPSDLMQLWAGFMEPPGKYGGPALALHDHRHDEMFFDAEMLTALGLDPSLASEGYLATIRFAHCVIGLLKVGCAELLPLHSLAWPRQWVQIWPAIGTNRWPPPDRLATGRLAPIAVGIRPSRAPGIGLGPLAQLS